MTRGRNISVSVVGWPTEAMRRVLSVAKGRRLASLSPVDMSDCASRFRQRRMASWSLAVVLRAKILSATRG
jgi:hypothetical protein